MKASWMSSRLSKRVGRRLNGWNKAMLCSTTSRHNPRPLLSRATSGTPPAIDQQGVFTPACAAVHRARSYFPPCTARTDEEPAKTCEMSIKSASRSFNSL
jgi:hypothetical protein